MPKPVWAHQLRGERFYDILGLDPRPRKIGFVRISDSGEFSALAYHLRAETGFSLGRFPTLIEAGDAIAKNVAEPWTPPLEGFR